MNQEKANYHRIIANANEQRRMKHIRDGFDKLMTTFTNFQQGHLIQHRNIKLKSKAEILMYAIEVIEQLNAENTELKSKAMEIESNLPQGPQTQEESLQDNDNVVGFSKETLIDDGSVRPVSNEGGEADPKQIANEIGGNMTFPSLDENNNNSECQPEVLFKVPYPYEKVTTSDSSSPKEIPHDNELNKEQSKKQNELNHLKKEVIQLKVALNQEKKISQDLENHILKLEKANKNPTTSKAPEKFIRNPRNSGIIVNETKNCYTVRNNMDLMFEAILQLEGDKLFWEEEDLNSVKKESPEVLIRKRTNIIIQNVLDYTITDNNCTAEHPGRPMPRPKGKRAAPATPRKRKIKQEKKDNSENNKDNPKEKTRESSVDPPPDKILREQIKLQNPLLNSLLDIKIKDGEVSEKFVKNGITYKNED